MKEWFKQTKRNWVTYCETLMRIHLLFFMCISKLVYLTTVQISDLWWLSSSYCVFNTSKGLSGKRTVPPFSRLPLSTLLPMQVS